MATRVFLPQRGRQVLSGWYSDELLDRTVLLNGSFFGSLFGRFGQHAVTINGTVHLTPRAGRVDSDQGIALVGHELIHVEQQREVGWWRFLARYLLHWRPSHVRQGWKHPMESPAYRRGSKIRDALRAQRRPDS